MKIIRIGIISITFLLLSGCLNPGEFNSPKVNTFLLDKEYALEEIILDFSKYSDKINPSNIILVLEKLQDFYVDHCPSTWESFYAYSDKQLVVARDFFIDEEHMYPLTIEESSFCRILLKYHITHCSNRGLNPIGGLRYFDMLIKSLKIRCGKNTKDATNWFRLDIPKQ